MKNPKKIPFGFKLVIAFIIALSISILYLSNYQTLRCTRVVDGDTVISRLNLTGVLKKV